MIQSDMLISKRRVRAAIFAAYDEYNPDNKPQEITGSVFNALNSAVERMIHEIIQQEDCSSGRLKDTGHLHIEYWGEE